MNRRAFLCGVSAATIATRLPALAAATSMPLQITISVETGNYEAYCAEIIKKISASYGLTYEQLTEQWRP
mgnify:CR=1 FL=1